MDLAEILRDEEGQKCFMEFLKKEFSQENLEFWLQCQEFKKIANKKQMKKVSEQIANKYISLNGSHSINIDGRVRKMVEESAKKPHCNMFDVAQDQIFQLMQTDSFARFTQSELFAAYKATKMNNSNKEVSLHSGKDVSTRKRKRTTDCSSVNSHSRHTYENESILKNAKMSYEDFNAKANEPVSTQIERQTITQTTVPREHNNSVMSLENIQCQNPFLFSGSDQCDSESLYCNAPIYSMDSSPESSQSKRYQLNRQRHRASMVDPKWFNNRFVRIVFPDCSEEFVSVCQKASIRTLVDSLLRKKGFNFSSYKMFSIQSNESIDLDKDISSIIFTDARIEQRITFSVHFPEGYLINVETLPNKLAFHTVQAILSHFGISWQDIELHNEHGHLLNSSLLMEPAFNLDHSNIYVNYLSSLRTYINLKDVNDLNEDSIVIRSIQFAEYTRSRSSKRKAGQSKSHTLPRSFNSFVVESPPKRACATIRSTRQMVDEKNGHIYANETKDIDLGDLSFSNENATDDFLTDIMTNDIQKLNFICTPQKQRSTQSSQPNENLYENVRRNSISAPQMSNKVQTPVHKARLVIIDENEYENVIDSQKEANSIGLPELNCNSNKPMYANQAMAFDERYCDCRPTTNSNILKPRNANLSQGGQQQNKQSLRRMSLKPSHQLVQPANIHKSCNSPISFTKYLLQQQSSLTSSANNSPTGNVLKANNTTPISGRPNRISLSANNNFTNFCITPLKSNKPDLLTSTGVGGSSSGKKNRMRTLSRFHKIL